TAAGAPAAVQPDPEQALGLGLGALVEAGPAPGRRSTGGSVLAPERLAVRDAQGRVLVQVTARAGTDAAAHRARVEELGMAVTAVEERRGVLEGFLPLERARAVSALAGTGTVVLSPAPLTHAGGATSQGVALQRVDRVQAAGVTGEGITIGALSDSYDVASTTVDGGPLTVRAADDVRTGDLPGPGNPRNPTPVRVLREAPADQAGSDEGRAMLQIAHDVAPGADLCFATALGGEVAFADSIRALADPAGGCGADVVVDDVVYLSEPFFSDGVVGDAVDAVAARGVHYFSSAGNQGEQQSWRSGVRLLPAERAAAGTNLDLAGVDPALYDGGLQDLDPGPGTDVAQDLRLGPAGGLVDLQWDDPVDLDGATLGEPLFRATGELTAPDPAPAFTFTARAAEVGTAVQFRVDAVPTGTVDLVLTVTAPDGTELASVDTGSSPEVFATTIAGAGDHTLTVTGFQGDTGPFTVDVRPVLEPSRVSTDFNLLLFDAGGAFLGAVADLNALTGRPQELAGLQGPGDVQVVVARSGTGPLGATRVATVLFDDAYFTEHADPLAPAVLGHAAAAGATAVGAHDPFRPHLPEPFTSPGGDLPVLFDSAGERHPVPQVRRKPEVSSADAVNTTFFGVDSARDADDLPNFSGTSAAAPHAAAVAALLLQRAGGGRSLSPAQLRERMTRSTFPHDLDPMHAGGSAGGLSVSADGPQGDETHTAPGPMADPRFFTVEHRGAVPLTSLTLYGESASPTAPGVRLPPLSDGVVFDPRPHVPDRRTGSYRGAGAPFAVGATSGGLDADDVTASFSAPAGTAGQHRHLTLTFARGLGAGQGVRFGVDRDLAVSGSGGSEEGNGADELGGAVLLPRGLPLPQGLAFTAVRADGSRLAGVVTNRLGRGFTPVDGYGVLDAEALVLGR
ncbi:S8 family serine peptidase, partial [Kineococcus indalonis]|uniref:S8 family serine peptidase n=1 Tax=Kineococcus indalonis TaxID=2696566 RepID=UPI001411E0DD